MKKFDLPKIKNKIIRNKEELPLLKEGYIRHVHFTTKEVAESIAKTGLDYSKQGMLMSTARGWSKESEIEFTTSDNRFKGKNIVAVIFDITFEEAKLHNDVNNSPGKVPADNIVGIIEVN